MINLDQAAIQIYGNLYTVIEAALCLGDSNRNRSLKNLIGGTVGGIVKVLTCQMFDMVKARLVSFNLNVFEIYMAIQITRRVSVIVF